VPGSRGEVVMRDSLPDMNEEEMEPKPIRHRPPPAAYEYLRDRWGLSRTVGTLAKLRCTPGAGPEFSRDGRAILYTEQALDEYARRVISEPRRSTKEDRMGSDNRSVAA
jgi:hypothetical protein